jgi:hypothetical protein
MDHTCYLPYLDIMVKHLELHSIADHGANIEAADGERPAPAPRLEKLPRPSFGLDMTETEWVFKESQCIAYIGQTLKSEQVKVQQLKAACDESLLCRCMMLEPWLVLIQRLSFSLK